MNYLEKLLDGVGVEWKTLGEVTDFTNGKGHEKGITEDGKYIVVNSKFISTNGKVAKFSEEQICPLFCEDILIVMSDLPNGKALAKTFFVKENDKYTLNQRIGGIRVKDSNLLFPKFLNYFLNRTPQLLKFDDGASQTNLRKDQIQGVIIPIPSIKIQQKIVAILDSFTKLTEELTAELIARKMQYSYYREKLYSLDKNKVQHLQMDDENIGVFQRGKRFVKTDLISEGVPVIHYGEMYTHYGTWADKTKSFLSEELVKNKNLRVANKGDVVIVAAGETIEDIGMGTAWLGDEDVVIHDACFSYKTTLNPKFVAYFTRTKQFHDQIKKHISSGKISAINSRGLGKAIIPFPSKEEQERVVAILDKFEILTNSMSEGLPKEIALRKKQYEYYRNLLLTFPKKN